MSLDRTAKQLRPAVELESRAGWIRGDHDIATFARLGKVRLQAEGLIW